jgi:hypothetical protein
LICLGKHLVGITTLEIEDLRKGIILSLNMALEGDEMKNTSRNDLEGGQPKSERSYEWTLISGQVWQAGS